MKSAWGRTGRSFCRTMQAAFLGGISTGQPVVVPVCGQADLVDPDPAPDDHASGRRDRSDHQGPPRPLRRHPRRAGGRGDDGLRPAGPSAAGPGPDRWGSRPDRLRPVSSVLMTGFAAPCLKTDGGTGNGSLERDRRGRRGRIRFWRGLVHVDVESVDQGGGNPCDANGKPQGNGSAMPFVVGLIAMVVVAGMMRHIFAMSGLTTIGGGVMGGAGIGAFLITPGRDELCLRHAEAVADGDRRSELRGRLHDYGSRAERVLRCVPRCKG